ncbi:hypothetical protein [Pseudomonas sp. NPDC089547]|uniref:hypothetical protein n=1 Tax=Pseudomonas sp. NPDC089547 TaxID=3390652 RepID=UPI003D07BF42
MNANEISPTLRPYFAALDRMVLGECINVPNGTRISRKTVALEAGKSEGSIKNSRPIFADLIVEIKRRAQEQAEKEAPGARKVSQANERHKKEKAKADDYKQLYEDSLARELMLLVQLDNLERSTKRFGNVYPLDYRRKPND